MSDSSITEPNLRPGLKWNYFKADVLPCWVAEMDYGLAPAITDALHEAIDRGDTGYPYPAIESAVAESGSRFWADRLGWEVGPDRVFHAPDVIEGIRRAISHLTRPGSPVILHTPVYFPFFSMVERAGREMVEVTALRDRDGVYRLDLDGIDRAFEAGAGSLVLCNPWNPVGRSLTRVEVEEVVGIASSHGARVIADEIHAALTFENTEHVAAASADPGTVVTVTAASKAWNLPGLKSAQVVLTNDEDLDVWSAYFTPEKVGVGTLGLIASAAAYSRGGEWLDGVMATLHSNRRLLGELIEERLPGVGYRAPEATYLAWLDMSSFGWDEPADYLLDRARVGVTGGAQFGTGGEGHVRLNFGTQQEVLVEIVDRIARALP